VSRVSRAARTAAGLLAVAGLAAAVALYVDRFCPRPVWHHTFDLRVYRGAVRWWLDGRPLYDFVRPGSIKGFTYPPFAALVLLPLALGTETTATVLLSSVSAVLVVLVTWWLVAPVAARRGWSRGWTVALAVPLVFALEPVRETFGWGQVDLVILALVLADVGALRRGRPWAGAGIGLATAIKVTPGLFVLYLVLTRRWRAALVAAGTFLGASLLALAVDPSASLRYWTHLLWQTDRVGAPAGTNDQSLRGLLARLAHGEAPTALWLLLAAAVLVAGLWRAVRLQRRGDDLAGVTVTGLTACLVSPISWSHHLVWVVPAVVVLADAGTWLAAAGALVVAAVFGGSVIWLAAGATVHDGSVLAQLAENSYVLLMLALVLTLPARPLTDGAAAPSAGRTTAPPRPAGSSPR
jgi:alpha-1,2-mannosyltransferase